MIIIDPGHGGWDPGGGSNNYFKEKDLVLKISNYQNKRFKELGLPSVLTRDGDTTLSPSDRLTRIQNLGATKNDVLISNHINNGGSGGGEVIYSIRGNNELPQMIANELNKNGVPIRNVYQRIGKTGKDYYFILRGTTPNNAMIIEYGFADNPNDTNRLVYEWPNLAEGVVKAITNYYQIPYTPPKQLVHVVKPNESLYSISKDHNTTVEAIKEKNNLSSDTIYPRMELVI